MSDPIEVLLQFAFLGVLYLFLLWVARSALRDLGRPATEPRPGLRGRSPPAAARPYSGRLVVVRGGGLSSGAGVRRRARARDRPRPCVRGHHRGLVRVGPACAPIRP